MDYVGPGGMLQWGDVRIHRTANDCTSNLSSNHCQEKWGEKQATTDIHAQCLLSMMRTRGEMCDGHERRVRGRGNIIPSYESKVHKRSWTPALFSAQVQLNKRSSTTLYTVQRMQLVAEWPPGPSLADWPRQRHMANTTGANH
eukprot:300302-Pelagomonas_calceolata.AAC.2